MSVLVVDAVMHLGRWLLMVLIEVLRKRRLSVALKPKLVSTRQAWVLPRGQARIFPRGQARIFTRCEARIFTCSQARIFACCQARVLTQKPRIFATTALPAA